MVRATILSLSLSALVSGPAACGGGDEHGHTPDAVPADSATARSDAGAPGQDARPDAVAADDGAPPADATSSGCTPTGVSESQATRKTNAASVTVDAILLNAVDGCPKDELRFKLVLDTHSVALEAIDLPGSARLETSTGALVAQGFRWVGGSESSHHRDGVLSVAAPRLAGATWIRLTLRGIAGVDRTFEWDASLLALGR